MSGQSCSRSPRWVRAMETAVCLALVVGLALAPGCAPLEIPARRLTEPGGVASLDGASPFLKAHMMDGSVYVLSAWSVDERDQVVSGVGRLLGVNRKELDSGELEVPIASVAIFETNVLQKGTAVQSMSVMSGLSLVLTGYCLANPKACFGSCPTFYAVGSEGMILQAEGFSSSVAPSLERPDVDALYRASPEARRMEVRMTNEAMETHVVRYADVLAVRRPPGGRVLAATDGRFYEVVRSIEPTSAVGPEGDCLSAVTAFDGTERKSSADATFLGAKEVIDLEFSGVPVGDVGLQIASRQSLMSTYLFYQALSYLGGSACEWIAALERGDLEMRGRFNAMIDALGGIEVLVETAPGEFTLVDEINESGPLATDTAVARLPHVGSSGPLRVRLRLTKGLWRLDCLALADLGDPVEPIRVRPSEVSGNDSRVRTPLALLLDREKFLTTYPGDVYTMVYELPDDFGEYELFLETSGYYLEWMREEWLAEEDLAKAMRMFLDPEGALRELAPEFAAVEADMEDMFWSSRYVR